VSAPPSPTTGTCEPSPGVLRRSLPYVAPALLVFLGSLLLDLRTLMPGLGFWDTGEFQTIGTTLGIAHPRAIPATPCCCG